MVEILETKRKRQKSKKFDEFHEIIFNSGHFKGKIDNLGKITDNSSKNTESLLISSEQYNKICSSSSHQFNQLSCETKKSFISESNLSQQDLISMQINQFNGFNLPAYSGRGRRPKSYYDSCIFILIPEEKKYQLELKKQGKLKLIKEEIQENCKFTKQPWKKDEDDLLVELVNELGAQKWTLIASHFKNRIGKQCRERWFNHLSPNIKKGPWNENEEWLLFLQHKLLGKRWAEMTRHQSGRTDNAIKNHWNSGMQKKLTQLEEKFNVIKQKSQQQGINNILKENNELEQIYLSHLLDPKLQSQQEIDMTSILNNIKSQPFKQQELNYEQLGYQNKANEKQSYKNLHTSKKKMPLQRSLDQDQFQKQQQENIVFEYANDCNLKTPTKKQKQFDSCEQELQQNYEYNQQQLQQQFDTQAKNIKNINFLDSPTTNLLKDSGRDAKKNKFQEKLYEKANHKLRDISSPVSFSADNFNTTQNNIYIPYSCSGLKQLSDTSYKISLPNNNKTADVSNFDCNFTQSIKRNLAYDYERNVDAFLDVSFSS